MRRGASFYGKSRRSAQVHLQNSENTLKFLILNLVLESLSGYLNNSGKVIIQEMRENKMGYRGSVHDPNIVNMLGVVKEQRLDCRGIEGNHMSRYSLTGFERDHPVKILSNQISSIQVRSYSTNSTLNSNIDCYKFNPW
jgi:hypothetical protein